ncbi:MAG: HyaD/HybD family hydrogenase maturation endopeptidase [Candidatus Promineifilaceae bacterium]|jgi:hydrogenase maturation protease
MNRQVLVLGIGNVLNTDEGVGVHAIRKLRQEFAEVEAAVAGVELQDGGTLGLSLLPLVEEATHLLLLDAVDVGESPGTLVELKKEQIPYQGAMKLSQHQVTFQEVLGLALIRKKLPEHLHVIGIQPASLAIGVDLSPEVQAALPEMLNRATRVLSAWGVNLLAAGEDI